MVFTPKQDSVYFIEVDGSRADTAFDYELQVRAIADDFPDTTDTTGVLPVDGFLSGSIDVVGDEDFIGVDLPANTSYQFSAIARDEVRVSLSMPYAKDSTGLGVADGLGRVWQFGQSEEIDADYLALTTREGGTFYLSMTADSPVAYDLSVQAYADDYADHVGTVGVIAPGGEASGSVEVIGDRDWFRTTLQAGVTYMARVTAEGAPVGDEPPLDFGELVRQLEAGEIDYETFVALLDKLDNAEPYDGPQFSIQAFSDQDIDELTGGPGREAYGTGPLNGGYSQVVFTPRQTSTYYFQVEPEGASVGTYQLSLQAVEDDFADSIDTLGRVGVSSPASGRIDAYGDADWFRAELQAGLTYRVEVSSDTQAFAAVPLTLFISSAEDGLLPNVPGRTEVGFGIGTVPGAAATTFTPLEDSTYYVGVLSSVQNEVSYELAITTVADDFPDHGGTRGRVDDLGTGGQDPRDFVVVDPTPQTPMFDAVIQLGDGTRITSEDFALYRTYGGALGRTPDPGGFSWWDNEIESGRRSIEQMTLDFLFSQEFLGFFPGATHPEDISSAQFVTHMYQNVFDRAPDPGGFDFWTGELDSGRREMTDVVIDMTASNEYVELTAVGVVDFFLTNGLI